MSDTETLRLARQIKNLKELVQSAPSIIVENSLTSTNTINALSANKGKELNDKINGTVLWTNPNSNAAFAAQTVTVSNMAGFSYYKIWFRHYIWYPQGTSSEAMVTDGWGGYGMDIDEAGNRNCRKFTYGSATSIIFDNGISNGSVDNNRLIPIKIVGCF